MSETTERLQAYFPEPGFSDDTLATVSKVAEIQQRFDTYGEFFEAAGVDAESTRFHADGYQPIEVLDVRRKHEKDVLVVGLPIGCTVDSNMRYQLGTLALTFPTRRIVAVSNPSGPGFRSGVLSHEQRKRVAHGDLGPFVEPELKWLEEQGIDSVKLLGSSLGVVRSNALAKHGAGHIDVTDSVHLEPPDSVKRMVFPTLAARFVQSVPTMEKYPRAAGLSTYRAARKDQEAPFRFMAGMTTLTNFALIRAIAQGDYEGRTVDSLTAQPNMYVTAYSGSKSEFAARDGRQERIITDLKKIFGDRIDWPVLDRQRHTLTDDPHLQVALALEGLRRRDRIAAAA